MAVYYLGGGTCCGKSTVTELLVKKHGFMLYKLDDYIFDYLEQLAEGGNETAIKQMNQSMQEMWLGATPSKMSAEETQLYGAMLPLAQQAIESLPQQARILAEGAGFLPALMHAAGVQPGFYACIVPTPAFRRAQYAKRSWIHQYLDSVSDKDAAFHNWMRRDDLLSETALEDARRLGYPVYVVDGAYGAEKTAAFVEKAFHLA